MLRKFSISGFRGFSEKITFDLTRAGDYEFNKHLVHNGIVSAGVIYGINGSGKSSLGFAIFDIVSVLTDYHVADIMKDKTTFINASSARTSAVFEYEFLLDGKIITYSYEKAAPDEIIKETVSADGNLILKRSARDTVLAENSTLNIPRLPSNMSALRFIYRNTPLQDNHPIALIVAFVEKMLWFRSISSRGYCGYTSEDTTLIEALHKRGKVKEFQTFLHEMAGLALEVEIAVSPLTGAKELYIKYPDRNVDFFKASSTGTQELLLLFYWTSFALDDVRFLFIDEFDAFYHFELAARIITDITRRTHMQVFFTSHNTYLATNNIMRPDCFFILSGGQITSFADATPRELREGHNLEKLLRSGEFASLREISHLTTNPN